MLATNMSETGNSEEKLRLVETTYILALSSQRLRWAFKMYDKDGSGSIEIEEMVEIVGNMFELEGLSKVSISSAY